MYLCLTLFALSILVPLGWSILAAFKQKSEFYGDPWALPEGFYLENFKKAFIDAQMGKYFINSIICNWTSFSYFISSSYTSILCIIKI